MPDKIPFKLLVALVLAAAVLLVVIGPARLLPSKPRAPVESNDMPAAEISDAGHRLKWEAEPADAGGAPALELLVRPTDLDRWWTSGKHEIRSRNDVHLSVMLPSTDSVKMVPTSSPAACSAAGAPFAGCHIGVAGIKLVRRETDTHRYAIVTGKQRLKPGEGLTPTDMNGYDLRRFHVQRDATTGRLDFKGWICPQRGERAVLDPEIAAEMPPEPESLNCTPVAPRRWWHRFFQPVQSNLIEQAVLFECDPIRVCRAYFVYEGRAAWLTYSSLPANDAGVMRTQLFLTAWNMLNRLRIFPIVRKLMSRRAEYLESLKVRSPVPAGSACA